MKIAVAALNSSTTSPISSYPLRAPYILLFDEAGGFLEAVNNPFEKAVGHKGYGIARLLSDNMVNMFIAGNISPSMDRILREAGIGCKESEANSIESVEECLAPGSFSDES